MLRARALPLRRDTQRTIAASRRRPARRASDIAMTHPKAYFPEAVLHCTWSLVPALVSLHSSDDSITNLNQKQFSRLGDQKSVRHGAMWPCLYKAITASRPIHDVLNRLSPVH